MQKRRNSHTARAPHTRGGLINACGPLDSAHHVPEDCLKKLREAGKIFKSQQKKFPNQLIPIKNSCSDVKSGNNKPSFDREPILCDFIIFLNLFYFFGLHPSPTHPPGGAPAGPCEKKIFWFCVECVSFCVAGFY